MKEYTFREEGLQRFKKKAHLRMVGLLLMISLICIGFVLIDNYVKEDTRIISYIPALVVILIFVYSYFQGLKKVENSLKKYKVTISDSFISRIQTNFQETHININDIKEISKNKNGSLTIQSKNPRDIIVISDQIDDFQELEVELRRMHPITNENNISLLKKYPWIIGFVMFGLIVVAKTSNNDLIEILTGITLFFIFLWSIIEILKSKNVDLKFKKQIYLFLFLFITCFVVSYSSVIMEKIEYVKSFLKIAGT
ncbi:MAG: hypothetical protein ACRCVT_07945 [Leadbetterella sp.]